MMTRKSVKIWIAKMKTDYASYLKTATRKLEEVLVLTQEKLGGKCKRQMSCMYSIQYRQLYYN